MLGLPRSSQKPLVFVRICLAAVSWHHEKCVCESVLAHMFVLATGPLGRSLSKIIFSPK